MEQCTAQEQLNLRWTRETPNTLGFSLLVAFEFNHELQKKKKKGRCLLLFHKHQLILKISLSVGWKKNDRFYCLLLFIMFPFLLGFLKIFWLLKDFYFFLLNPVLLCFFFTIFPTSAQTFCSNYRLLFSHASRLMSLRAPRPLNSISWGNCQFSVPHSEYPKLSALCWHS